MTPQEELKNYLNFWQQKGQSPADLVVLLRSEADQIEGVSSIENPRDVIAALSADNASHVDTINTLTSQLNDANSRIDDLQNQVTALSEQKPVDPDPAPEVPAEGNGADASNADQATSSLIEGGSQPDTAENSQTSTDEEKPAA